ncbi:hypothetical protein FRX31_026034 [Thalictrum thalictroides]|uniref:Uncharacterized protein n=1 Tax=Thalictrum thalictroides TaxID=46969 RepID=A0A7J6VH05_THATH|nr:hypothetical protein FRX31_026034 [Thalictrum thalictroides]
MRTTKDHKRQMWKYGRIFESEFLATLQTRACPKFMYILGCILKRVNSETAAGILDIKQLEEVSQDDRQKLWLGSKALVDELKKK